MTLLDVSIVNVALPSIRQGLHASASDLQWIVAGYALAYGIILVPAGRLGDARSRRAVFGIGLALFTLASGLAGAAPTSGWLSLARIVQGLAAGMIAPQVSGFIQTLFSGHERGRAFGLFGATIGISTAVGPLLGGALVNAGGVEHGWRLVFYVNVPVGIVALLLVPRLLPPDAEHRKESLDPVGVLLFGAATFLVLWPLVEGEDRSLADRPWWVLGVSAVLLALFAVWERGFSARGNATLVDLSLLRVRSYMLGLSIGTLYFAGFTSIFLVLTLYLQNGLGYDALEAGLTQMPFAIGSAVASTVGGRLVSRLGRPLVVAGLALVAGALLTIDLLVSHLHGDVGIKLAAPLLLAGIGGGLVISPNVTLTLSEVDPRHAGSGGGMLQTAQRVGSAIGIAVVLAQFFSVLRSEHGDFTAALSTSMHTTVGFVILALVLGLVELVVPARKYPEEEPVPTA
jgi:EmrB/QacA subfamily drug resistance transporter